MKKLIYIAGNRWRKESGVSKKILNEIKAFQLNGINAQLVYVEKNSKIKQLLPLSGNYNWLQCEVPNDADYLCIRYELSNFPFLSFLKRCKKKYKNLQIILDMGTYPYIGELRGVANPITIFRDIYYSKYISKYVDRIIDVSGYHDIFDVKTIEIVNPIQVEAVRQPMRQVYRDDNTINIVAIATMEFFYGYDRLIKGLADYYDLNKKDWDIQLHFVGEGNFLTELKRLTVEYQLDKHITFYGFRFGTELDEIYEIADIGIDVLGAHRKNEHHFGTLKSREYMCKGIPFVTEYSLPDEIMPIKKYILKVPDDESNIDFEKIVDFFTNMKSERKSQITENMRGFAKSYCDVKTALNPVINYLEE